MVTKGIITSIDFNGNTCKVRVPFFESAGNDQIISDAIISNTPGMYNGYKVGDVVLVAFEDGQMDNPVVIGKLYLGVEKEKADPRGSLNTETLAASKTANIPSDTKLTVDTDKNLPNTMNPYANLSSIANNLNKLNTDVNYLDAFAGNQFRSIITNADGMSSRIEQNAANIEAKVDREHDGTTTGLGWNLTDTKWTIDATNTSWPTNKLTLFEIDRDGQVIINGNVRIGGYPQSRIRFYKKLAASSAAPSAPAENTPTEDLPDLGWYEVYEWENSYHIWETIQTIAYDTDSYGELQPKITYSAPVDITGAAGEQGIGIKSQTIYYAMVDPDIVHVEKPDYAPEGSSNLDNHVYGNSTGGNIIDLTTASPVKGYGWSTTPHEYIDNWNYYTSVLTIYSDDNQTVSPVINHRNFADPVKAQELDGVYELAQGKSKNYYSEINPAGTRGSATYGLTMQEGYCWFDTGYTQISTPDTKSGYLGKWLRIPDNDGDYIVKSGESPVRLVHWKAGITDQRYTMIKVDPDNIDTLISDNTIVVGTTEAFETGILSQWDGTDWIDISGELVTNKLTANYINAMDITAKKITVLDKSDNNKKLFEADGINGDGSVSIANFTVKGDKLYSNTHDNINSTADGIYIGSNGISIGNGFKVSAGGTPTIAGYTKATHKKYCLISENTAAAAATAHSSWWNTWAPTGTESGAIKWQNSVPDREDEKYIWEWTKDEKGDDRSDHPEDWDDLGKVCFTGTTGAPGSPGAPGRSVESVIKYYQLAISKPNPPTALNPSDWFTAPPNWEEGKNYYESDRTLYDDGTFAWSEVIENSMLSVDFINSLGITAEALRVPKTGTAILSANIANESANAALIGGFTITEDSISNNEIGEEDSILISTGKESDANIANSANYSTSNKWALTVNNQFGVTTDGVAYINNGIISGNLTVESGSLQGISAFDFIGDSFNIGNVTLSPTVAASGQSGTVYFKVTKAWATVAKQSSGFHPSTPEGGSTILYNYIATYSVTIGAFNSSNNSVQITVPITLNARFKSVQFTKSSPLSGGSPETVTITFYKNITFAKGQSTVTISTSEGLDGYYDFSNSTNPIFLTDNGSEVTTYSQTATYAAQGTLSNSAALACSGGFIPDSANKYNLGDSDKYWKEGYFNKLYLCYSTSINQHLTATSRGIQLNGTSYLLTGANNFPYKFRFGTVSFSGGGDDKWHAVWNYGSNTIVTVSASLYAQKALRDSYSSDAEISGGDMATQTGLSNILNGTNMLSYPYIIDTKNKLVWIGSDYPIQTGFSVSYLIVYYES